MNLSRKMFLRGCAAMLLASLAACSSGSRDRADLAEGQCPAVGDLTVTFVRPLGSAGICQLSGTLTVSAVLVAGIDWRLDGFVQVGNASSSPTLAIAPGATLRGDADGITPEYLRVFAGASLLSLGTKSDPVIFSSNDDDYLLDPATDGEWGGIIIEDSVAAQGNSRLEYTIIAEAGAPLTLGTSDYRANLTLSGPHDNTRLSFVQSHGSGGDGISIRGNGNTSTVRGEWLLVTGSSRDGIAYSNFSGLLKDLLVVHDLGLYINTTGRGGRAGIYAAGAGAAPLIVNATLYGRDDDNADGGLAGKEFGIIFEEATDRARLANIAIVNFRNGCYEVGSDADLSAMALNSPPVTDTNFVDGVHCTNEFNGTNPPDPLRVVQPGGIDIPVALRGLGDGNGLRSYNDNTGAAAIFAGQSGATTFTASWYLASMAGRDNSSAGLRRYNGGDTDENGTEGAEDTGFRPLFSSSLDSMFAGVRQSAAADAGFNLRKVGAVRSSSASGSAQFDGWTLQDGAVDPVVSGYLP